MNNLVIMHDRQAVTTSLKVAETFGKNHNHVMRDIKNLIEQSGSPILARQMFAESAYANRGKHYPMYYMNRDGFTLLAMGFTGKQAMGFKLQYIEAFNSMERQVRSGVPQTLPEALRLAADQAEQIEKQQELIAIQAPKAIFADAVAVSHTTILIGELAKLLRQNGVDVGQNRLFQTLREQGYLINRKGTDWNQPTQRSADMQLFKVKETAINHSDGTVSISKTVKVTGKGQQYFINKFLRNGVA